MMPVDRPMPKTAKARRLLSVQLSPEQYSELEGRASRQPLSAYARDQLFAANDNQPPATARPRSKTSDKDTVALTGVLAVIGPMAQTLKQLAQGIASGILPFSPDTEAALLAACHDIAEIKSLVMRALGIRER